MSDAPPRPGRGAPAPRAPPSIGDAGAELRELLPARGAGTRGDRDPPAAGAHGGVGPIPADAEARLERAIQLDLDMERLRGTPTPASAFTFGLHARVELTPLRLLTSEIGLLERAIRSDVSPSGRG
jgi:hypothetical protein